MVIRAADAERVELEGLRVVDYGRKLGRSSSLARAEVAPGARHPRMRSPRTDRYFLLLSGRLTAETDVQGRVELAAGDLWVVPVGEWWSYVNEGDEPCVFVLCHTPPLDLDVEELEA